MRIHVKQGTDIDCLEKALEILRSSIAGKLEERRIILHEGTYYSTSLKLLPEDSGLVIEGSGEGRAVLSGGVAVKNWQLCSENGWFYAKVPIKDGRYADFRSLITTDGRYLKLARYPLTGSLPNLTPLPPNCIWKGSVFGGWGRNFIRAELDNFVYDPKDIPDTLINENAYIQVFHSWNESFVRLVRNDKENHRFYVDPPCGHPPGAWKKSYAIWNTVEGMAEDGRWYCDNVEHVIYYRPFPYEKPENFEAVVPLTESVIHLEAGCRDITIRRLDVTAASSIVATELFSVEVQRGAGGFCSLEQSGAIQGSGVSDVVIEDVSVYYTGATGIKLRGERVWVKNSHVHHTGAAGICICLPDIITKATRDELPNTWPAIEDNRIEYTGLQYHSGPGIYTESCMVKRNYIAHTSYSGIVANGDYLLIEDNIVTDPMLELNDGAAIYKHLDNYTVIRNNHCILPAYRNGSGDRICMGIYLDAPGFNFEVCNNTITGFAKPSHTHVGQPGTVWRNNVMVYNGEDKCRITTHRSEQISFVGNVIKCGTLHVTGPKASFGTIEGNAAILSNSDTVTYHETTPDTVRGLVPGGYTSVKDMEIGSFGMNMVIKL